MVREAMTSNHTKLINTAQACACLFIQAQAWNNLEFFSVDKSAFKHKHALIVHSTLIVFITMHSHT